MDQLAHAFLFSGPRGVGKTTCARILAKAINCNSLGEDGEPCNDCNSCSTFNEGRSMNIHELDAASNNSVEDIRKIIEIVRYVPTSGKKSVFIIDEVHMLSSSAFNAFLKTLEEPPKHAVFILATTEKLKILPTILSRVQKFDFRRIKVDDVANHLKLICEKEGVGFEYEALQLIGLKADGALRDALSIFDQIISYSNRNITYQIVLENLQVLDYEYFFKTTDHILAQDHGSLLLLLHEIIERGFEAKAYLAGLIEHFRNLMIARTPKTMGLLETSDNVKKRYLEQTKSLPPTLLLNAFNLASKSEQALRNSSNARLAIELCLIKLAYLSTSISLAVDEKKKPIEAKSEKINLPPSISAKTEVETGEPIYEQKPKVRKSRLRSPLSLRGGFSIPTSLADVDLGEEEKEEEEAEEFIQFIPDFQIDPALFGQAYDELLLKLEAEKKPLTVGALRKDAYELEGNKWIQNVPSDVAKRALYENKDVLLFMRERINVPNLIQEIVVKELGIEENESRLYSNDDKLKAMIEKNPELAEFLKTFSASLKY